MKQENVIIVRLGEIYLKSEPVRRKMIQQLVFNIKASMGEVKGFNYQLKFIYPRIYIFASNSFSSEIIIRLRRIFGITSISTAFQFDNYASLQSFLSALPSSVIDKKQTFAVQSNRLDKDFPKTSSEINKEIGEIIIKSTKLKVDLDNPDITFYIDYHQGQFFLYWEKIDCYGGLPIGVSGKAVALLSSGFDSPVAIWLMMRRGLLVYPLHLEINKQAASLTRKIWQQLKIYAPGYNIELKIVPHQNFLQGIKERLHSKHQEEYICLLCKRKMLREAEVYAKVIGAEAIITGDSLGQVASQTLSNLKTESSAVGLLILRPLVGKDKEEIIKISREIGLYELSAQGSRLQCPYLPQHAVRTKSATEEIDIIERQIIREVEKD